MTHIELIICFQISNSFRVCSLTNFQSQGKVSGTDIKLKLHQDLAIQGLKNKQVLVFTSWQEMKRY